MAECDSGQRSPSPCHVAQEQGDSCQPSAKDPPTVQCVSEDASSDLDGLIKHRKHQNGIVTHLLKATDDADNGESADSGHGSSCHDCECATALSQLATIESEMTQLSPTDDLSADPSVCQRTPGVSQQSGKEDQSSIRYVVYESEVQMPDIIRLITKDLSEPYSIYTYRYFIHNWPKLCLLVSCIMWL